MFSHGFVENLSKDPWKKLLSPSEFLSKIFQIQRKQLFKNDVQVSKWLVEKTPTSRI